MDAITAITERRSVRSFSDTPVDRATMREIVSVSRWAPSWANFQIARYTLVDNPETIVRLANEGFNDFMYNINTLRQAKGAAVLSFVKGKSGKFDSDAYVTSKESEWEVFDAGIACQTFCLAAHARGVGTCIMGVINADSIAEIVGLPTSETAAALIVYGYEEGQSAPSVRKEVDEILRFL